jgi:hypothetical protein
MPPDADERFLVLHALRLKGLADNESLVLHTGLSARSVELALAKLDADGHATERSGRMPGWLLTAPGRVAHAELVAADLDAAGADARPAVVEGYQRFLRVNQGLLRVCTDWQMRSVDANPVLNDHSDPDYDRDVISRLVSIDDVIQPIVADVGRAISRMARYGPRLRAARDRIESGQLDWFTKPVIDSYHTVWFELHEDLLATLGIERSKEEV